MNTYNVSLVELNIHTVLLKTNFLYYYLYILVVFFSFQILSIICFLNSQMFTQYSQKHILVYERWTGDLSNILKRLLNSLKPLLSYQHKQFE